MTLTMRQQVLNALRGDTGRTARELSRMLGVPEPSVRRNIHELRGQGWLIGQHVGTGHYVLFMQMPYYNAQ